MLSSFAFAVLLPSIADLQKEFGEQLVAAGLVGAAMEIFERTELWDNLLICYRLLEKVPQALALVKTRLEVRKKLPYLELLQCLNLSFLLLLRVPDTFIQL